MKKRLLALISSLAIVVSLFSTVALAADATLDLSVGLDDIGYYYVDVLFDVPDVTMDYKVSSTSGRNTYYKGMGVYGGQINIDNITAADFYEMVSGVGLPVTASNIDGTTLKISMRATKYSEMLGEDAETGAVTLCRISTNYAEADKTEDEIKEMFSTVSYAIFKITPIEEETLSTTSTDAITNFITYASYEGDYGIGMKGDEPEVTATPEPTAEPTATPVPEKIPTATQTGAVSAVKIGDSYEGDDDSTDVAAAVAAGLKSGEEPSEIVLWTVTANGETRTHEQRIASVSGGTTIKVGLVIHGLAQSAIDTVTAVLQ